MPLAACHDERAAAHRQILAQWLGMSFTVQDTNWPVDAAGEEIPGAKEEEGHVVMHGRLHIGNQRENMCDGHLLLVFHVEAASFEASRIFNDPQVLAQVVDAR